MSETENTSDSDSSSNPEVELESMNQMVVKGAQPTDTKEMRSDEND